jgi:hypothetical protein
MNNNELGMTMAYLLRHRYVETKSNRRNISKEEREVAYLLRDAEQDMLNLLREIFNGQELNLVQLGEFDVAGIPSGATTFMVTRQASFTPLIFGMDTLLSRMRQVRPINTDTSAKVWFIQLWFIHLDLIYSSRNRAPNELQDYVSAVFTKDAFLTAVKEYINDYVLKVDTSDVVNDSVYRALSALKDGSIAEAVNAFLELMVDSGLLERNSEETYRQTLLSAYEMKENYNRQLSELMPASNISESVENLLVQSEEISGE